MNTSPGLVQLEQEEVAGIRRVQPGDEAGDHLGGAASGARRWPRRADGDAGGTQLPSSVQPPQGGQHLGVEVRDGQQVAA